MTVRTWVESFVDLPVGRVHVEQSEPVASEASSGGVAGPVLFLHEGLGSIGLWRGFHQLVAEQLADRQVVAWSRVGYGQSEVRAAPWRADFLQTVARDELPQFISALNISRPWLVGHSDGASIALIRAAQSADVAGLVLIAPHVCAEEFGLRAIRALREPQAQADLVQRMARHHRDAAATFDGWSGVWTSSEFARTFELRGTLGTIGVPVLVIQGSEDQYGTTLHVDAIADAVAGSCRAELIAGAGHAPHLEQPAAVADEIARFIREQSVTNPQERAGS